MNYTKLLAIAFMLVFASQALALEFNEIAVTPGRETVFTTPNNNIGLVYTFRNLSNEQKCVQIEMTGNSPFVSGEFADHDFCLNAGESTQMALTILTTDAPRANYTLEARISVDGQENFVPLVDITVGENGAIEVIPYPTDVCRGEREYINVLVRNKTAQFKTVELNAENELLLPSFETTRLYLDAYQERNVKLYVHTNSYTMLGPKEVSIYATTGSDYIKRTTTINVKDCEGIVAPNFEVTLSSTCSNVEKTKASKINFSIRNLSSQEQAVYMAVLSDLPSYLSATAVTLDSHEERTFQFDVNARISDEVGDHNLTLVVWNQYHRIEKHKCIRVRPIELGSLSLLNDDIEIRSCETGIFRFSASNIGDQNIDVNFRVSNVPEKISVDFSDSNFKLAENHSKEIFMYVSVEDGAELGNYDLNVLAKFGSKTLQFRPSFTVVEKTPAIEKGLVLESYPLQVQATPNSEKTISIELRNNSDATIDGISVRIKNLPQEIHASAVSEIVLFPTESKKAEITLTIGDIESGFYKGMLEITSPEGTIVRDIEFAVSSQGEEEDEETANGILAGLFTLGENLAFGLVFAVVILLLAIIVIGFVVSRENKNMAIKKELWVRR
ncbi:MAG: hypothetical protein JW772_01800 [Candidatus Diapherotrites archaeon]|nr:hypothetical protein [Candidatus Diapherotrites archaeon]